MREEILRLLEKGKEVHEQLISTHDESSPGAIKNIVEQKLPGKINGILVILNANAKKTKYQPVSNVQQAIDLFTNTEIQQDMDKAIANKELVGLSACEDCFITVNEILDGCKRDIQSIIEELNQFTAKSKAMQL